jgi:hypothetical protein
MRQAQFRRQGLRAIVIRKKANGREVAKFRECKMARETTCFS